MKLKITNRSAWPDYFVRPICRWVVGRAKISHSYAIELPAVGRRTMLAGCASRNHQRSRINRRFQPRGGFPYETRYWRYQWSTKYMLRCRIEAFVDIVAHEAAHAVIAPFGKFRRPDGRNDDALMESTCEQFSKETVEAFRLAWPAILRPRVIAAARKQRTTKQAKRSRKADPAPKLAHVQEQLARWQRKAKLAATKIRKYRKQVKYYEGRVAARNQKET